MPVGFQSPPKTPVPAELFVVPLTPITAPVAAPSKPTTPVAPAVVLLVAPLTPITTPVAAPSKPYTPAAFVVVLLASRDAGDLAHLGGLKAGQAGGVGGAAAGLTAERARGAHIVPVCVSAELPSVVLLVHMAMVLGVPLLDVSGFGRIAASRWRGRHGFGWRSGAQLTLRHELRGG